VSKLLSFDFEYEHDYTLIAIHTTLEDFRAAYYLNRSLNICLERYDDDLDFELKKCSFPLFEYKNRKTMNSWYLISNKFTLTRDVNQGLENLFTQETNIEFLIPEKNRIDYFLKISEHNNTEFIQKILNKINNTYKIITSYIIDPYSLKSRDNLII
jgi:hypothetical protein